MKKNKINQHELRQNLANVSAMFSLWFGIILGLISLSFIIELNADDLGIEISLAQVIPVVVAPGVFLTIYWFWKARKLTHLSIPVIRSTIGDDDYVSLITSKAKTIAFHVTAIALICSFAITLNDEGLNRLHAYFYLSTIGAFLFSVYGGAYLVLGLMDNSGLKKQE